jgi:hypothetical protein
MNHSARSYHFLIAVWRAKEAHFPPKIIDSVPATSAISRRAKSVGRLPKSSTWLTFRWVSRERKARSHNELMNYLERK